MMRNLGQLAKTGEVPQRRYSHGPFPSERTALHCLEEIRMYNKRYNLAGNTLHLLNNFAHQLEVIHLLVQNSTPFWEIKYSRFGVADVGPAFNRPSSGLKLREH